MTYFRAKLLIVRLVAIAVLTAAGLLTVQAQNTVMFRTIDETDGMNSEVVTCIEVDAFGYIWIGTKTGLERYDGSAFVLMSSSKYRSDLNTAIGNSVADIKHDFDGNIWVATERGVSKFDIYTNRFSFIPIVDGYGNVSDNSYQADILFVDSLDNTYFFSQYHGLNIFDSSLGSFRQIFADMFLEHDIVYCHKDDSDCFWLLSEVENVIYKVDVSGRLLRTIPCGSLRANTPAKGNCCFLDNGDGSYFFGGDNGLVVYDENNGDFHKLDAANVGLLPTRDIRCLFRDSRGTLWIGSMNNGLYKYDKKTRVLQRIEYSPTRSPFNINSPTTADICEDARGLVWFGTWKGIAFTSLHPLKDFHNVHSACSAIIPEKRFISSMDFYGDTIAIGSYGGGITFWLKGSDTALAMYGDKKSRGQNIIMTSVHAVAFDHNGYCYNSGYNRNMVRIHPDLKTIDEYKVDRNDPNALHSDHALAILCDSKNRIWVLTKGDGLYLLEDPDRGIFRNVNAGADGTSITSTDGLSLAEFNGKILVGTYQGLSVYDPEKQSYVNYKCDDDDPTSLSHNWVIGFCIDSKRRIWVATNAGFDLFDIETGKFTTYDTDCGLLSDVIQGIVSDDQTGLLWVSTSNGISKFDPATGTVIRTYLASDGMLADNYLQRSAFKDKDGTMYFGAVNGFTYFKPSEIRIDSLLPMPTITRLMLEYDDDVKNKRQLDTILSDKAPEATDKILLDSKGGRTIIIQFATLNFVNESGNKYSYMLKGYEDKWVDIGTRHEAVFTNLDYGEYIFMIKCRNADGVESDVRPLKITVLRPLWRHPLMITLAVLLILGAIIALVSIRNRASRQRQKILETTVKKRTEDLVMANVSLEIQKEEIEKSLNSTLILNDLSRQITSSFDALTIIMTAYNHIKMIVKMDFFAIGIQSVSKQIIEFNHIYFKGSQLEPDSVGLLENNTEAKCLRANEDSYTGTSQSHFCTVNGQTLGSIFVLPLREASKPNGILTIGCLAKDVYTSSDRANIRMISSYVSIALEKAKDYHQLQIKNNAINGSIRYAKTIQEAILVHESYINTYFNAMIIFRPKDIVSGDFYWFKTIGSDSKNPEKIFAAVVDCTGHGVPGAFMSLISNILLSDIIIRNKQYEPHLILSALDKEIINALNQANNNNEDGLDMAICRFDRDGHGEYHDVVYAGAKNPLYYYNSAEQKVDIIAADRISIGGFSDRKDKVFTSHKLVVQSGDCLYMASDGIVDQNNTERKRFGRTRLIKTLEYDPQINMEGKKQIIEEIIDDFMEGVDQRDDMTIMGLKIS